MGPLQHEEWNDRENNAKIRQQCGNWAYSSMVPHHPYCSQWIGCIGLKLLLYYLQRRLQLSCEWWWRVLHLNTYEQVQQLIVKLSMFRSNYWCYINRELLKGLKSMHNISIRGWFCYVLILLFKFDYFQIKQIRPRSFGDGVVNFWQLRHQ